MYNVRPKFNDYNVQYHIVLVIWELQLLAYTAFLSFWSGFFQCWRYLEPLLVLHQSESVFASLPVLLFKFQLHCLFISWVATESKYLLIGCVEAHQLLVDPPLLKPDLCFPFRTAKCIQTADIWRSSFCRTFWGYLSISIPNHCFDVILLYIWLQPRVRIY